VSTLVEQLPDSFGPQINELTAELARAQEARAVNETRQNSQIAEATAQVCVNKGTRMCT